MNRVHHDGNQNIDCCYQCRHMSRASECTLMKEELRDIFKIPLWCPLPSTDEEYKQVSDRVRAIEVSRLLGVLRSTVDRRCAPDQVLSDALTAVECEIAILVSSLDKKEKLK